MKRPFIVGIAGGTASGKTTLAMLAARRLDAGLLTHDRYYKNANAKTNFDHPDALETERLVADLDTLRSGHPADAPLYDFATHTRREDSGRVEARPIILVEGILVLTTLELRARFDLPVYVQAAADVRLIRRVRRDIAERGRDLESVLQQYLTTVRPMHELFVEPSAVHAELVLDGEGAIEHEVDRLVWEIHGRMKYD